MKMKIDNYEALQKLNQIPNIVKTDNDAKLREETNKFEAIFIKEILDVSLKSNNSLFPKSAGEEIYQSMYNGAISNKMSGHFGFSKLLFNYLKSKEKG